MSFNWLENNIRYYPDCDVFMMFARTLRKLKLAMIVLDYCEYDFVEEGCKCGCCLVQEKSLTVAIYDTKSSELLINEVVYSG